MDNQKHVSDKSTAIGSQNRRLLSESGKGNEKRKYCHLLLTLRSARGRQGEEEKEEGRGIRLGEGRLRLPTASLRVGWD